MPNAYENKPLYISSIAPTEKIDWGVRLIGAPEAWMKAKGEGVKVALLDTGVDFNHKDLKIAGGCNFTTSDQSDFMDRQGHGTHCAGIIAGTDNDIGVIGVAPAVELYAGKVLSDDGSGSLIQVMQGVDWAIQNKFDIVSMSLGCSEAPPDTYQKLFKLAYDSGIIIVVAAGNEGSKICWPAVYPEVLSVGAIDDKGNKASFSNFGPTLDIVAPGVNIYSTYPGNRYALLSGTSMATPMVSGAVALYISYARSKDSKATFSLQGLRDVLKRTCIDLGPAGKDTSYGIGMINVDRLLRADGREAK